MKKNAYFAIIFLLLSACYTPLNNSGVATTKPWLEIMGTKNDFGGKQYDSCYRFDIRFWPQEAADQIDLRDACISSCCWRTDKEEVTLDFNKNFEQNLAYYGRARKYSPEKITLKVSHANWLNTTKVSVSPQRSITNNGLIKLSYKEYENPTRLAQIRAQADYLQTRRQANLAEQAAMEEEFALRQTQRNAARKAKKNKRAVSAATTAAVAASPAQPTVYSPENEAKRLLQQEAGNKIDEYFYQMNKQYRQEGAVFLISDRFWQVSAGEEENEFLILCQAKARSGADLEHLRASTFPCGWWKVNPIELTVRPADKRAQEIWEK